MASHPDTFSVPELVLINNDPPGIRCNRNLQVAAQIHNQFCVPLRVVPRSMAGSDAIAPAVYLGDQLVTIHSDSHNGVVSKQLLGKMLRKAGIPSRDKPGRLEEIEDAMETLQHTIGEVPS